MNRYGSKLEEVKSRAGPSNPEPLRFQNKLNNTEPTAMSQTFTFGQNRKKERDEAHDSGIAINSVDDCIRGYFPRARSGGSIKTKIEKVSRRFHSDSAVMRCEKLPSVINGPQGTSGQQLHLDGSKHQRTLRPWSKTSIELQKYKDALQNL
ncbi:unnamed protein product, partial [Mesorhabditis spiculigera]